MTSAIRTFALAAGAAALLSTQAAYAVPISRPAIDPLVSLSVMGTAQSRAAVCAAGASAAAAGAAVIAAQAPGANCLLPLTAPTPVPQAVPPEPVPPLGAPGKDWTTIALIGGGLLAIIVIAVLVLSNDDDEEPVSPA